MFKRILTGEHLQALSGRTGEYVGVLQEDPFWILRHTFMYIACTSFNYRHEKWLKIPLQSLHGY